MNFNAEAKPATTFDSAHIMQQCCKQEVTNPEYITNFDNAPEIMHGMGRALASRPSALPCM
jgi:hypothetical protein